MRKLFVLLLILNTLPVFSQNETKNEDFTTKNHYLFKEFTNGIITFYDGRSIRATINYSVLLNEIHFMQNDQILVLGELEKVQNVRIGEINLFPHNNRVYQLLYIRNYRILKFRRVDFTYKEERSVIYGSQNQTAVVQNVSGIDERQSQELKDIAANGEDKPLKVYDQYYIFNNNKLIGFSEKNLLKLHKNNKESIEKYLSENKINIGNEIDLLKLVEYCNSIK